MDKFYNLLPLIISLALNILQYLQAKDKQEKEHTLNLKRLEFEQDNKEKDRQHDVFLKKLEQEFEFYRVDQDNQIYVQREVLPKLQELFTKYSAVTKYEIFTRPFPIDFSENQQNLEMAISIYCPEVQKSIENFNSANDASSTSGKKELTYLLYNEIIPTLSHKLEPHPTKYKEETLQK